MALAIVISAQSILFNAAQLLATVTDSVGPNEYEWYKSTTQGFSPGPGNLIAGADEETLDISGLIPNTIYYFRAKVTDTGNSNTTATSAELTVTTASQTQSQNQFTQAPTRGNVDQAYNTNTVSVLFDPAFAGQAYAGTPVKLLATSKKSPLVVTPCTAETDNVLGFINFNAKNNAYTGGMVAECSLKNNVIYLYATAAIEAGASVQLDLANNGIKTAADANDRVVGWAFDAADAPGDLFRVYVGTPTSETV